MQSTHEASVELHDYPLLPVVRAQWLQGCHVFQVTEHAGMSLGDLVLQEGWQPMSHNDKAQVIRQIIADVLLGLVCNVNRISAWEPCTYSVHITHQPHQDIGNDLLDDLYLVLEPQRMPALFLDQVTPEEPRLSCLRPEKIWDLWRHTELG
jgi:hypothetical protein